MNSLQSLVAPLISRRKALAIQAAAAFVAALDVLTIALIFPLLLIVIRPRDEPLPEPFSSYLGSQPPVGTLYLLAGILVAVLVFKNLAMAAVMWAQAAAGRTIMQRLAERLLRGYLAAPLEFHVGRTTSQITRAIQDLPMEIGFTGWLNRCNRIAEVAGVAAMAAALALIEPLGMLGAGVLLGILLIANHKLVGPRMYAWGKRNGAAIRRNYGLIADVFPNIKVIKTTASEDAVRASFALPLAESAAMYARNRFGQLATRPLSEIVMIAAGVLILVAIMWGRERAIDTLPALAAFTYAVFRLLPAATRISNNTNELRRVQPLVEEAIAELAATQPFVDEHDRGRRAPAIAFRRTLELRDVSYCYPDQERFALRGIDLTLSYGEVVGLAGESGAGKSTLVDVMLGLLEPTEGELLVDGAVPARTGNRRGTVGYVPQNSLLLDVSARENVALGVPRAEIDDACVAQAVEGARLEETIAALPGGLDGRVGEHGRQLSGGQRQRFGIARAIYGRPSLLVMDEATSDLDMRTEFEVSGAIGRLRGSTTIVLIAHRMHVLKTCDRVIFMHDGRIEDEGTYEQLLVRCERFRELATMTERYETTDCNIPSLNRAAKATTS